MNRNPLASAIAAPATDRVNSPGGNWRGSSSTADPFAALTPHLSPLLPDPPDRPGHVRAAVLLALTPCDTGWGLIMVRRALSVAAHPGQLSFPGGKREPRDPDDTVCALRESREETGLPPERVRLLGRLPPRETRSTGFWIQPVVGWVAQPSALTPDPREVAEIFLLPLTALAACEHDAARDETRLPCDRGVIWGATASLLLALRTRLERVSP